MFSWRILWFHLVLTLHYSVAYESIHLRIPTFEKVDTDHDGCLTSLEYEIAFRNFEQERNLGPLMVSSIEDTLKLKRRPPASGISNGMRFKRQDRLLAEGLNESSASPTQVSNSYTTPAPTAPAISTSPTTALTQGPTELRNETATQGPTQGPSQSPSQNLTQGPTQSPTQSPSQSPTQGPTRGPSQNPSQNLTQGPTQGPSQSPSQSPTQGLTQSPTQSPTQGSAQSFSQSPTTNPTQSPTQGPTQGSAQSSSQSPTTNPTQSPTQGPTQGSAQSSSQSPTTNPTQSPTQGPTQGSAQSSSQSPTTGPTQSPAQSTSTGSPTTALPSSPPTTAPSATVSEYFSVDPGNCSVVSDGRCVASPGWGETTLYPDNSFCRFQVLQPGVLRVEHFDVKYADNCPYDFVEVDGVSYCGSAGPEGVTVSTATPFVFFSDEIAAYTGFLICWEEPYPAVVIDDTEDGTSQLNAAFANQSVTEIDLVVDVSLTTSLDTVRRGMNISGRCGPNGETRCIITGNNNYTIFKFVKTAGAATLMIELRNLVLRDGFAENSYGAALYGMDAYTTIVNCELTHNYATGAGGAVLAFGDYEHGVELINCTVANNAAEYGGAVYAGQDGYVKVLGGRVSENSGIYGGAFFIDLNAYIWVDQGAQIANNLAKYGGGGIFGAAGASITVDGRSALEYNEVLWYELDELLDRATQEDFKLLGGGGILAQENVQLAIYGSSSVSHNFASIETWRLQEGGGGIAAGQGCSLWVAEASAVNDNRLGVSCCGGGILLSGVIDGGSDYTAVKIRGGSTVDRNYGNYGAGIGATGEKVTIEVIGSSVSSNESPGLGGGISTWSSYNYVYITDGSQISGNAAQTTGGGVFIPRNSYLMLSNNVLVERNTASSGAGIWIGLSATVDIGPGVTTSHNSATTEGGGIYVQDGDNSWHSQVSVKMSTFTNNFAGTNGGGLFLGSSTEMQMQGGLLAQNACGGNGGGVYVFYGTTTWPTNVLINGTQLLYNMAQNGVGGGLYLHKLSRTSITGGAVLAGSMAFSGAAIAAMEGLLEMDSGVLLANNSAMFQGGTISSVRGTVRIENCAIRGSRASYGGGGIAAIGSNFTLTNFTLEGGLTTTRGGGIFLSSGAYLAGSDLVVRNCASDEGGGVMVEAAQMKLTRSLLVGNKAQDTGGAVAFENGNVTLSEITLLQNGVGLSGLAPLQHAEPPSEITPLQHAERPVSGCRRLRSSCGSACDVLRASSQSPLVAYRPCGVLHYIKPLIVRLPTDGKSPQQINISADSAGLA
ncbi:hypothetical protein CYMTET_20803 [Cymbomonas tetramitiformis]|uniref:EF-hand domain-containing protein n=1 Tax=Cymbomonas tetramitiformis TaxID=36881 RepID=A0AAE0L3M4_9CHLO|nr:hypothetical protein CYMTET_20803 [Cymbomonas tetramitiformis]